MFDKKDSRWIRTRIAQGEWLRSSLSVAADKFFRHFAFPGTGSPKADAQPGRQEHPPRVDRVPYIPMLKESNARKGFLEKSDFLSIRDALPFYLRHVVTFAYKTGWRKAEVTGLNRTVYLDKELQKIFGKLWQAGRESGKPTEYVFLNETGSDGIRSFRGVWDAACIIAGLPGKLFHDLRRSAVRNMTRANTPEVVAMKISATRPALSWTVTTSSVRTI